MFSINKRLSISKKLTLIYSSILLSILIVFTLITFLLIRSYTIKDSEEVLSTNADIISNYIESMKNIDSNSFNNISLSQGIYYSVYDDKQNVIFSNIGAASPMTSRNRQDKRFRKKDEFQRQDNTISTTRIISVNGKNYYVIASKGFEDLGNRVGEIAEILVTISILGLAVSLMSGSFLARKILAPIKDITKTAREITSRSLSKRIATNGAKDELSDLADTFNLMIERLEVDFEKQRRFVSDASHELRTPLAVMHGHVNMLNRWGKNSPEQLEKSLKTLKNETENMNKLVENLLCLAKGDNDVLTLKKEEFLLCRLLKEVTEETQLNFDDIEISYSCSEELKLYADYSKLKQVLRIIVDNSIKFSKESVQIRLEAQDKAEGILVTIEDNGIGIPAESLPRIFDRFYRVDDSRTKTTGGTGLGLSIAKQIIEYHKGRITADSKQGEGTKISILLPKT